MPYRLELAEAEFEITQVGKECRRKCAIYYQSGDCIMPREGVFARVLVGGVIRTGDIIRIVTAAGDWAGSSPDIIAKDGR